MRLEELIPKEEELLKMSVESLALQILKCLVEAPAGASIRRRGRTCIARPSGGAKRLRAARNRRR